MPWSADLYGRLGPTLKPTREKWLRWMYGDEIEECIGETFTPKNYPEDDADVLEAKSLKWAGLLSRFQKYGHYSTGNLVTVLEGGDTGFPRMLAAIERAHVRVWCESYIFDNSAVGRLFFEALRNAAVRGCDVVLLVDYIGSYTRVPSEWVTALRGAGAEVVFFNPLMPPHLSAGPYTFRDHRKILVCDEVGFCGGMNIHEEVGEEIYGTNQFYDVHVEMQGPCVADLAEVFKDSLCESGSSVRRPGMPRPAKLPGGCYVQILQSNVRQKRRTLQKVISRAIGAADDSVALTTAYFFPPGFLRRALVQVPSRGASLSILLSGSSDFYPLPGDLLAQTHFLGRFLHLVDRVQKAEAGGIPMGDDKVSIHLYQHRHMHAKHMTVDGVFSTIGSFNFDLYSARRNLEVGISVFDRSFAQQLRALHDAKVKESKRTTLDDMMYHHPVTRFVCGAAYAAVRLSGRNFFDGLDCFQRKWLVRKAALTYHLEEQAAQFVATSMMWGLE